MLAIILLWEAILGYMRIRSSQLYNITPFADQKAESLVARH